MIKIIESGTRKVIQCDVCGCKFSYEKDDVQNERTQLFSGFYDFVECPQCYNKVVVTQCFNKIIDNKNGIHRRNG